MFYDNLYSSWDNFEKQKKNTKKMVLQKTLCLTEYHLFFSPLYVIIFFFWWRKNFKKCSCNNIFNILNIHRVYDIYKVQNIPSLLWVVSSCRKMIISCYYTVRNFCILNFHYMQWKFLSVTYIKFKILSS